MGEMTDEDAELVARIARGDMDACGLLYRRYLPLVLRWSLRQTGNREVAADLASEVFAAAMVASARYDPERGSAGAWLLGIAKNKLRESRRHRRVEDSARRALGLGPIALTDASLDRVEELASLDSNIAGLVEALPEDQREAVLRRVVEERSYEEIARELRCSPLVARQRVSRGLRALKCRLEGQ
jgi:RNA polymerase sigma factor (sigma-70 family)